MLFDMLHHELLKCKLLNVNMAIVLAEDIEKNKFFSMMVAINGFGLLFCQVSLRALFLALHCSPCILIISQKRLILKCFC